MPTDDPVTFWRRLGTTIGGALPFWCFQTANVKPN